VKLTVLGGAGAGGNTGQGCSGYLVEVGATRVVLDLGPGTLPELRRHADFRTLDAIVVSHLHLDHVLDLMALRFALAYNPVQPSAPIPLWLPPGGLGFLRRAAAAFAEPGEEADFFPRVFAATEYDPTEPLTLGAATVTFAPTVHYIPCWAMRVAGGAPDGDLGYTADTGPASKLTDLLRGVRVLIAEGNWLQAPPKTTEELGHLTATEAAQLAREVGARTLVLTHLWEENGFDAYRAAAVAAFAGLVEVGQPGLCLAW